MVLESLILFSMGAEAPAEAPRAEEVVRDARVMRLEHGPALIGLENAAGEAQALAVQLDQAGPAADRPGRRG